MADTNMKPSGFEALRKRAEQIIEQREIRPMHQENLDLLRIIEELEVYQVELEIQNDELRRVTRQLESSRKEYFDLFDAAPVGFVTLNRKGLVERYNHAATGILSGDTPALIADRSFSSRIHPSDQKTYYEYMQTLAKSGAAAPPELRVIKEDGTVMYVHLEARAVKGPEKELAHWRVALVDITERKTYEKELKQRTHQLARMSGELTRAEERERRRLAKILHDHLQQLLVSARFSLEALQGSVSEETWQPVEQAIGLLKESLDVSRSLTVELSPPVLYDSGLIPALEWLVRWTKEKHGMSVVLERDAGDFDISDDLKMLLFSAVRELLLNVMKHAEVMAAQIEVIRPDPEHLRVVVSDRGAGFAPARSGNQSVFQSSGFGLFSIKERLEFMGGDFHIRGAPGRGTTVYLTVPVQAGTFKTAEEKPEREISADVYELAESYNEERKNNIRVMLVDDHDVMRQGLSSLLSGHPGIEVIGEASDGEIAVQMARELAPDVILMDISMPKMNGIEATMIIHREQPEVIIIGLSMFDAADQAEAIKNAGAAAYLKKSGNKNELLQAIHAAVSNAG